MAPQPHPDHDVSAWTSTYVLFGLISFATVVGLCFCFRRSMRLIPTGVYMLTQRLTQPVPEDERNPNSAVRRGLLSTHRERYSSDDSHDDDEEEDEHDRRRGRWSAPRTTPAASRIEVLGDPETDRGPVRLTHISPPSVEAEPN
ncbi:hypothetical protein IWQ60_008376 [Tieghemiomyces parasiticus]|uniref:Uncharacterized protein n=1 Tax=Tieghemiomyces parasiticus TaxID=78921 RepID=A0A9W7ZT86_9FUNG|nr:hypothetical protein IWQ60_008376 [Tieghemiomyces parasiticus]